MISQDIKLLIENTTTDFLKKHKGKLALGVGSLGLLAAKYAQFHHNQVHDEEMSQRFRETAEALSRKGIGLDHNLNTQDIKDIGGIK